MKNYNKFRLTIPKNLSDYLLYALPQTNNYQTVNQLKVNPNLFKKINCQGNQIIYTKNKLLKNRLEIYFHHKPKIFENKIDENLSINDYGNVKITNGTFINGNDTKVKKLQKQITGKETQLFKIIKNIYSFTLEYLKYGKPIPGLHTYKQALEEKITDCGGFSTFMLSLLQSAGLPGRLVVGFILKDGLSTKLLKKLKIIPLDFNSLLMHAWLEILLPDNSWLPIDPSVEWRRLHNQSTRKGGFGFIPDDRLVISYGQDFKIKIENKNYSIDLIQYPVYL